jgi:hypothetical protein
MEKFWKAFNDYRHIIWLVIALIGAVVLVFFVTSIFGNLISDFLILTGITAALYGADYHFKQWLNSNLAHWVIALLLAVIGAAGSSAPVWKTVILFPCDIVIVLAVFAISAWFWPNRKAIQDKMKTDPLGAARDGLAGGVSAVKGRYTDTTERFKKAI